VVGAGRVGTALAVLLRRAGHRVVAVSGSEATSARAARHFPGVPLRSASEAAGDGDVVILGVPDDVIAPICLDLAPAFRAGRIVLHLSGSVGLDALVPARDAGSTILSLHPLQTAPTVDEALARFPGSGMAVTALDEEGYVLGERLVRDVGGRPFRLPDDRKPLYHAAAVTASNFVTVLVALAGRLFREAGLEGPQELFAPLVEASVANAFRLGPDDALTGPAVRGDAGSIARNLSAIAPQGRDVVAAYVALTELALDLAERSGRLEKEARARVEEVLDAWR
jgi:predicted short-subunit dehydrogenase-like oxidoreductase (DUF2520 family)